MAIPKSTKEERRLLRAPTHLFICFHRRVFSARQKKRDSGHQDLHRNRKNPRKTCNLSPYKSRAQASFGKGTTKGELSWQRLTALGKHAQVQASFTEDFGNQALQEREGRQSEGSSKYITCLEPQRKEKSKKLQLRWLE